MTAISAAAATLAAALSVMLGATGAWWMHRRTRLSPRNAYLAWCASIALIAGAGATQEPSLIAAGALTLLATTTAAVSARRCARERTGSRRGAARSRTRRA